MGLSVLRTGKPDAFVHAIGACSKILIIDVLYYVAIRVVAEAKRFMAIVRQVLERARVVPRESSRGPNKNVSRSSAGPGSQSKWPIKV